MLKGSTGRSKDVKEKETEKKETGFTVWRIRKPTAVHLSL